MNTSAEETKTSEEDDLPCEFEEIKQTKMQKVQEKLARAPEIMNKVSSIAYKASSLVTTLMLSKNNPVAAGMAVLSLAPEVLSFFGSREDSKDWNAIVDEATVGYDYDESAIISILQELGILKKLERTQRVKHPNPNRASVLVNVKIDGEVPLIYVGDKAGHPLSHTSSIYIKKGHNLTDLISKMIQVEIDVPCAELSYKENKIALKPVIFNGIYVGKNDPVVFADNVEKFKRKGLDYSIILYGEAGVGKTSFIMSYAELRRKRVLIVGPDVIDEGVDLSLYIDILKPDVLLLDDYDRSGSYNFAYSTLPILKSRNPNLMVVITCNHPSELGAAILRPGRGGHLIEFEPPSKEDKLELFQTYLKVYKVENPEKFNQEEMIDALTDDWTHDWVRHLARMCLIYETQEEIMKFIEITNQQLVWVGKSTGIPEE